MSLGGLEGGWEDWCELDDWWVGRSRICIRYLADVQCSLSSCILVGFAPD